MLNEFLFTKIEEGILGTFGFNKTALRATADASLDVLRPVFGNRIISRRADVDAI